MADKEVKITYCPPRSAFATADLNNYDEDGEPMVRCSYAKNGRKSTDVDYDEETDGMWSSWKNKGHYYDW